jgi:exopolysaccharide biosynthesis polyprenyl glycosylphosphotransferase
VTVSHPRRPPTARRPARPGRVPRPTVGTGPGTDPGAPGTATRATARSLPRSWMIVTPVDLACLLAPVLWAPQHTRALLCMAALTWFGLTKGRRYRTRLHISLLDDLPHLTVRLLAAAAVVATVTALRHEQEAVTSFLVTAAQAGGLFLAGRAVTYWLVRLGRRRGVVTHRTLIVGGGPLAGELATIIGRYPQYGLSVAGYVDDAADQQRTPGVPRLGGIADTPRVIQAHGIHTVLVVGPRGEDGRLIALIRDSVLRHMDLLVVPRLHQFHTQDGLPDHIGAIPVMRINNPSLRGTAWLLKRGFDVVVGGLAILLLSPALLACAVAVLVDGGRPVLFRQRRIGADGVAFTCLKFRSMRPATAAESATQWSIARDPRVSGIGRFLRRTSLDELPQLWNVVRGEMTLVGPRPERPHFVGKFSQEIPSYRHRHRMRGGLTGLAQVSGLRGDTPIDDRARFDNYYIDNWSLWLDAKIIVRSFREVVGGSGG